MECSFCGKICLNNNSHRNHERTCPSNPNRKLSVIDYSKRRKKNSNQFLKAKELGLPIPVSSLKGRPGKGTPHTEEFKSKQRELALSRGFGGVTQSRKIQYEGKTLGSTYELAVAKSLDENNIRWDTCRKFYYTDPFGKYRTYTPDFYLPDYDIYLDPKNDFLIEHNNPALGFKDSEKINRVMEQNDIKILILDKEHLSWDSIFQALKP